MSNYIQILNESFNKRYLDESTKKMHPMEIYVMLLNFFSDKNFNYLLNTTPKIDKNGKQYNAADYCFHHIDGDHTNNLLNNVIAIRTTDHDLLTHSRKELSDCDYVDLSEYIKAYGDRLLKCAENVEEERIG